MVPLPLQKRLGLWNFWRLGFSTIEVPYIVYGSLLSAGTKERTNECSITMMHFLIIWHRKRFHQIYRKWLTIHLNNLFSFIVFFGRYYIWPNIVWTQNSPPVVLPSQTMPLNRNVYCVYVNLCPINIYVQLYSIVLPLPVYISSEY